MGYNGHNRAVGRKGEDLACIHLMELGHTILERNWRSGHLEIDIISLDRNGIHFVEVKSRLSEEGETSPEESVTRKKQMKLYEAARRYLAGKRNVLSGERECHFDVLSVLLGRESTVINSFPDAFFPGI